MLRKLLRAALVPAMAAFLTTVPLSTAADASGWCGSGTPFVGTTAGNLDWYEYSDWYEHESVGQMTIQADHSEYYYSTLEVWDSTCTYQLCWTGWGYNLTCNVDYSGTLNIAVGNQYGYPSTYTITAIPGIPNPRVPAECEDGIDNDLNGSTDYPNDPGCSWYSDNDEASGPAACSPTLGVPTCVLIQNGTIYQQVTAYGPRTVITNTHSIVGTLDVYRFPLATGGSVTAPCVVLSVNSTTSNGCQSANGTFVTRLATLVNQNVQQPGVVVDVPLATARICHARYTVTVSAIGVEQFPAYSLC